MGGVRRELVQSEFESRVIVALDYSSVGEAMPVVTKLDPPMCRLKVGKELHSAGGPDFVKWCIAQGFEVFLDLKFHDISTTVAKACCVNAKLGVWMMSIHASGGSKMMKAARKAVDELELEKPPLLIAVTVLTSLVDEDLEEVGISPQVNYQVLRLAKLARECGMDGVVCSALEAPVLRKEFSSDFKLITPGISLDGEKRDDQERVATPRDAILAGANYLVIGRPITQAEDPVKVLQDISIEIAKAL
ncbi:MAG TPA: orotidine-5'-phosphate decarboxylase [Candidatus Yonathbacteria bacterium]|nr:orotidine-5'-phosphate decarboxylase [Candidatus Yonathbacteria bacterium]